MNKLAYRILFIAFSRTKVHTGGFYNLPIIYRFLNTLSRLGRPTCPTYICSMENEINTLPFPYNDVVSLPKLIGTGVPNRNYYDKTWSSLVAVLLGLG
jgi:hypothetical protein